MTDFSQALKGVTVLSLAEQFPGPLCTRLLGDLGAEVIQLERPTGGDPQRDANPWLFRFAGIGKRSVTLDLKDPAALSAARLLVEKCDVLVEGFRPGVMERLGLSYEAVRELNPTIVYCSISGYGQDGPYRGLSGHNINYEAVSGYLEPYLSGEYEYFSGGPPWGDVLSGSLATSAIMAGLRQAATGESSYIDISITDSLVFGLGGVLTRYENGGPAWQLREGGYGLFACQDGHLALGISHEDTFWRSMCSLLGLDEYAELDHLQRIEQRHELRSKIAERLAVETVDHWLAAMGEGIPCSRVNRIAEVSSDPQLRDRGLFTQARAQDGEPFTTIRSLFGTADLRSTTVPALGTATISVLEELGLSEQDISALLAQDRPGA
ncbi:MAG TPA: CaiB/BaiF CoA-transferase family protein [Nocardioides sp.]|jgi:crotonobetainyl-CoA:carnitine CoA-transferase CaiB-like acyl-CoA transferase|uniref:CaiB/BaiF CoA transferase family protein n=1 Tax=Nocardioides sp. TaxID=35761 RepID=UPI002E30BEE0|nr:CaiB/BaiF CoA-transferase family protein [Nocardioides sp.]HEX3930527.1 CaiB/BaiF CoA-transferase family protein [Nocardioides sp.]